MPNILQVPVPNGQAAPVWASRDSSVNSLLFINQDLNNMVWIGQQASITPAGPNTIPLQPNGTFSGDASVNWYVVGSTAGISPLVVVPNGQAYFLGITAGLGNLVIPSIQSPNYVPATSGWQVDKNGNAEFNDVIVRGTFETVSGLNAIELSGGQLLILYSGGQIGSLGGSGNTITLLSLGSPLSASTGFELLSNLALQGPAIWQSVGTANEFTIGPSGDATGAKDTANINAALSGPPGFPVGGYHVKLMQGIYFINAPIVMPTGSMLTGVKGNTLSLTDYGSTIKAVAAFTGAAMLTLTGPSEEQFISDITMDGSIAPTGTHGIQLVSGAVNSVRIQNVNILKTPGTGLINSGGTAASWDIRALNIHRAGNSGINLTATDSYWGYCYIIGSGQIVGSDGWIIGTASNSSYVSCRVEDSLGGNGFKITSSNKAGNGVWFTGCSTQGNAFDGFSVTATTGSASPVHFANCNANEDGVNGGAGGGGFAGFAFRSCSAGNPVYSLSGCMTTVNTQFTPGGAPQYGLVSAVAASNHIRAVGCLLWGLTAGVNTDATAAVLDTTLSTTGVGLPATPATFTN